jgi:hypothetical protein|nr:MAG TPA: hypothetical protein [Caudoviricetes sp.]
MKKVRKINRLKSRFVPVKFSLKEQRKFTDILSGKRKVRKDRDETFDCLLKLDEITLKADLYCAGLGELVFSESEMEAFSRFEKVKREFYHGK